MFANGRKEGFMSRLDNTGSNLIEQVVFVLLVVICIVIIFSVGSTILGKILQPDNPFVIKGKYDATKAQYYPPTPGNGGVVVSRSDNQTAGVEFSWSMWLFIDGLKFGTGTAGKYLHVFSKGDNSKLLPIDSRGISAPNNAPGVYLDSDSNTLRVIMNTFEHMEETVDVDNIPMKKWVHVLVRVEGQYLDVYINGTLARRTELTSVPKQNDGGIYVAQNGGFSGFISNLRYYNRALSPGNIVVLVNEGPNLKESKDQLRNLKSNDVNYLALDWYFKSAAQDENA